MRRLLVLVAVFVAAGLLVTEATMQPTAADRVSLYVIYAVMALVTALLGWWLPRLAAGFKSLQTTLQLVAVAAVGVAAGAVAVAALSMFLSAHDLRLVLVALGLGVGLGVSLAIAVTRPLAADLAELASVADRVGAGDLTVRARIERNDEVGTVATAVDSMIDRLDEAEQSRQKVDAARRDFLAAVGHDLRTPLTALQAAVEAMQDGVAPDADRYLHSMAQDVDALHHLVDDLFLLARIEGGDLDGEPLAVDLAELTDDAVEAMHPTARRRDVRVAVDAPGRVTAWAEPEAVGRVLRNLLDNAIRHTPSGSEVAVSVGAGSGGAEVTVADAGPGFSDEFRALAFDSFARADPARGRHNGGAGLGLAIAKGLIEAYGGEIWVGPGPGGRVSFRLPAAA